MDNYVDENETVDEQPATNSVASEQPTPEAVPENVKALVRQKIKIIKEDKKYHKKAFAKMKQSMRRAMRGADDNWNEANYKANVTGRHVKQKTAALYAKNPKAVARRAPRLDFAVWDEDPQSLMIAMQTIQTGVMMQQAHMQGQAMPPDPMLPPGMQAPQPPQDPAAPPGMGHNGPPEAMQPFEPPPGFEQAQALLQDFMQGTERRKMIDKVGKTMEILYQKAMLEQMPVDFKTAAKQVVRRTCTTAVGYVELGFQREYGPRIGWSEQLADAKARLDHLRKLAEDTQSGKIQPDDPETAELEASVASLQEEAEILIREGLVFDFPRSTKVIPDKQCKQLVGFLGARHLTLEYEYTCAEVQEIFGVELKKYTGYNAKGDEERGPSDINTVPDDTDDEQDKPSEQQRSKGLVRVWKMYDKPSGLVFYMADGHDNFLKEPAAPDVFVEDFWPVRALTFNEVENDDELFPPSDVELMKDQQNELNRSRQGKREHRDAARPRWVYGNGMLAEDDIERLKTMKAFESMGLNLPPQTKITDIFQAMPVPGVDPNLYDTNETFGDLQLVVGADEAQFGGTSKATATESAIAEGSTNNANTSSKDDLDGWLTWIARTSGVILMREMSEEQVMAQVGPGALWPHMSLEEIVGEVYLEVEAGSSGRPNQAVEMHNWERMLPMLIQMPGIKGEWLARETLKQLDDRMDLTDALVSGLPAIVAQNRQSQPGPSDPNAAPQDQGAQGADNTAKPGAQSGGGKPEFGSNQV